MKRRNLLALALASPVAFSVARAQTLSSGDYRQMQVGRDEPILEPDIPIIDAHHHLVDRPGLRYMIDDYLADTRAGHRVVASVYVETLAFARTDGPEVLRPLGEIEFANGIGAMLGFPVRGAQGPHRISRAGGGLAPLCGNRHRGVRRRPLPDGKQLPPGRSIRGLRAPVERTEVHRPVGFGR